MTIKIRIDGANPGMLQTLKASSIRLRQTATGFLTQALPIAVSPGYATCFVTMVYLLVAAILPAGGFYVGDQGVKFAQVDALARNSTLALGYSSDPLSVVRPAFTSNFFQQVGGEYRTVFPPAYALLSLPFYLLLGMRGLVAPGILGAALAAYFGGLIARQAGVQRPGFVTIAIGLGSPIAFYAVAFWEHAISAGFVAVATYVAFRRSYFVSGIASAIAIWFRPETAIFVFSILIAVLLVFGLGQGSRYFCAFAAGLLVGLAPLVVFNALVVGSVLGAQVEANKGIPIDRLDIIALHLIPLGRKKWFIAILVSALALLVLRLRRRPIGLAMALFCCTGAAVTALNLRLLAQGASPPSIIDACPFILAALSALIAIRRDRPIKFLAILTSSYVVGVVFLTPTWGGGGWGPRMILGGFPLLVVLAWAGFERTTERLTRISLLILLALSLVTQAYGIRSLYNAGHDWQRLNAELSTLDPPAVATAVWWLPQVSTPLQQRVRWYGITGPQDLGGMSASEESFWWVWTDEPARTWESHDYQSVPAPPFSGYLPVAHRTLSIRGLNATLYRVGP